MTSELVNQSSSRRHRHRHVHQIIADIVRILETLVRLRSSGSRVISLVSNGRGSRGGIASFAVATAIAVVGAVVVREQNSPKSWSSQAVAVEYVLVVVVRVMDEAVGARENSFRGQSQLDRRGRNRIVVTGGRGGRYERKKLQVMDVAGGRSRSSESLFEPFTKALIADGNGLLGRSWYSRVAIIVGLRRAVGVTVLVWSPLSPGLDVIGEFVLDVAVALSRSRREWAAKGAEKDWVQRLKKCASKTCQPATSPADDVAPHINIHHSRSSSTLLSVASSRVPILWPGLATPFVGAYASGLWSNRWRIDGDDPKSFSMNVGADSESCADIIVADSRSSNGS
ncbi:hypothetical protein BDZ89DRAFT_1115191 [Hymenopellis radicata]|nr:hypothetical protein BDZ89DRAFT_1115191 [Hymenopellis radicata]